MSIITQKITDEEIAEVHVEGAPDSLIETPVIEIKRIFDKLPKLVAKKHNGLIDELLIISEQLKDINHRIERLESTIG